MKLITALMGALLCGLTAPAWGQSVVRPAVLPFTALQPSQVLVVTSTAQGLNVPLGATAATFSVTGGNVLYRDDSTAPTATTGTTLYAGSDPYTYTGPLNLIQFILPSGGASATVTIGYYKQ